MLGWIILAVYVIGYFGFTVTIIRFLASDKYTMTEEAVEKAMLTFLGMFLALMWPLIIPGGYFYKKVFAQNKEPDTK